MSSELPDIHELKAQIAQVRGEFDKLQWRKRRLMERMDRLAAEIEGLETELAVARMVRDYRPSAKAIRMEIL